MGTSMCRLCALYPAIRNSHILPAFLFRAIKADSPTGFLRNPNNPNRRLQDGDKTALLCPDCEQRFGVAEGTFARNVWAPFHASDVDHFDFGPSLHYFMTSMAWRTLTLDLPGLKADPENPKNAVEQLVATEETMRKYLLGADGLAACLRHHAIVWTKGTHGSTELSHIGPNVMIRRSVFGYTIVDQKYGYSAVLHNLAGFLCFLIVKGNPRDRWEGTKIDPLGGTITQPQQVNSWLIAEFLGFIIDNSRKLGRMSNDQAQKIEEAVRASPDARGLRFREIDRQFQVTESADDKP